MVVHILISVYKITCQSDMICSIITVFGKEACGKVGCGSAKIINIGQKKNGANSRSLRY